MHGHRNYWSMCTGMCNTQGEASRPAFRSMSIEIYFSFSELESDPIIIIIGLSPSYVLYISYGQPLPSFSPVLNSLQNNRCRRVDIQSLVSVMRGHQAASHGYQAIP
jgi:hypothetical protein